MATASTKKWWKNAIAYQIYPRSFCDSNGDGIGDLPGIISKLHYLKDLGVDLIWLAPIYPSPDCNNGYDISDYKGVNPDFGTMEDMERLISRSKRLGIKIVLELVINNTSDQHEWFKKALEGDQKYRDYYYFRDGGRTAKPNNWGSFMGGNVWSKTEEGDYYLHLFSKNQPDLDWHNPEVFDEFADIMRFWLDKGVAGFRCDGINLIYKSTLDDGRARLFLTGREHYLNTYGCHEVLKRFNSEVWSKYKTFNVGETIMVEPEEAKPFCQDHQAELDAILFSEHMDVDSSGVHWIKKQYKPHNFIKIIDKWQNELNYPVNCLENYNQIRSVNHFGNTKDYWEKSAKLLCGLNFSLKGLPFIYEGEEIGMIDSEHSMGPFQWDASENAGFTTGTPWMKISSNSTYINVKSEIEDEKSVLNFYKKMIEFRKASHALADGTYRKIASPNDVYIFTREAKEERLYIYCNLTAMNKAVEFYGDKIIFGNYNNEERENFYLKPYEFRIVASNI